jgi:hypothetical protein
MASAVQTPDVKVKFSAEDDTSVKGAVQQLVQELQNLKNKQTKSARARTIWATPSGALAHPCARRARALAC